MFACCLEVLRRGDHQRGVLEPLDGDEVDDAVLAAQRQLHPRRRQVAAHHLERRLATRPAPRTSATTSGTAGRPRPPRPRTRRRAGRSRRGLPRRGSPSPSPSCRRGSTAGRVWSRPPDRAHRPSGDSASVVTRSVWPVSVAASRSDVEVPELDGAVVRPGDELLAVHGEAAAGDDVVVGVEGAAFALAADLADARPADPRKRWPGSDRRARNRWRRSAGCGPGSSSTSWCETTSQKLSSPSIEPHSHCWPFGRRGAAGERLGTGRQRRHRQARRRIPQPQHPVPAARQHEGAVGRVGAGVNLSLVPLGRRGGFQQAQCAHDLISLPANLRRGGNTRRSLPRKT